MPKMNRIKESSDFQKVMKNGKWYASECLTVYILENNINSNRVGVAVGKKAGKSVVRNRIKRLIREAYRLTESKLQVGFDIIIVWRSSTDSSKILFDNVQKSLLKSLNKSALINKEDV